MGRTTISTYAELKKIIDQAYFSEYDFNVAFLLPHASLQTVTFHDCNFNKKFTSIGHRQNLIFERCHFQELNLENANFDKKVRFRDCYFHNEVNISNTKFNDLADFWRCKFYKPTTFYKTDFLGTTVFSAATFKKNVLFTYTLIDKLILFRGSNFEKGLDLSLAIISGEVGVFDIRLGDYPVHYLDSKMDRVLSRDKWMQEYEVKYENAVSKKAKIPVENKIETFRIIKERLIDQENIISSIRFNTLEKSTYLLKRLVSLYPFFETEKNLIKLIWYNIINLFKWFASITDIILLSFNWLSNGFGKSYLKGIVFTIAVAALFFNLLLATTPDYVLTYSPSNWNLEIYRMRFKEFANFLLPTHTFEGIGIKPTSYSFYIVDIVGRIFVGYGIYQTIQAFRKFR